MTKYLDKKKDLQVLNNNTVDKDNDIDIKNLLTLAINKQNELEMAFNEETDRKLIPLILIQLPSDSEKNDEKQDTKNIINEKDKILRILKDINKDYTIENKVVAVWLSTEKTTDVSDLTNLNSSYRFLILKQAIATGWDCPRAKILVKIRMNMDESFEIQTIGRIKRSIILNKTKNEEIERFNNEKLNCSYIYTFDQNFIEKYKEVERKSTGIENLNVKFKNNLTEITLPLIDLISKEKSLGSKELAEKIKEDINSEFQNRLKSISNQTKIDKVNIIRSIMFEKIGENDTFENYLQPIIIKQSVGSIFANNTKNISNKTIQKDLNKNSFEFNQAIKEIVSHIGLSYDNTYRILCYLFYKNPFDEEQNIPLISLNKDFYNFIYNAKNLLKHYLNKIIAENIEQNVEIIDLKKDSIPINYISPKKDIVKIQSMESSNEYTKLAYKGIGKIYGNNMYASSIVEKIINEKLNDCDNIEYFYKNGDCGEQYFSIPYLDGLLKKHYFYPDYLIKTKDSIYIIETKGEKDIDKYSGNKFCALKNYIEWLKDNNIENVYFYFIRNQGLNNSLVYSNEIYKEDINDTCWTEIKDLNDLFKSKN